jgi:hypothetical protein
LFVLSSSRPSGREVTTDHWQLTNDIHVVATESDDRID